MANYANLKATINANIKANGAEEITGPILNTVLNQAVTTLGAGYQYMGVATPATSPGTPDANVFYIAATAGTYTNFGSLVVAEGEVAILKYNGSWAKEVTGAATAAQVTQLGQKVDEFAQGKFYGYFSDADELPTGDVPGFAYVGTAAPFAVYNYNGTEWVDSGVTIDRIPAGNGEDIDYNTGGLLQFANRDYDAQNPDGMGYVILRKNKTFAEQVTAEKTIYEIRYPFTLSEDFTMPANCVLDFRGGSIDGAYTLNLNDCQIIGINEWVGQSLTIAGKTSSPCYADWFVGTDADKVERAIDMLAVVHLNARDYNITRSIEINKPFALFGESIPECFGTRSATKLIANGDIGCILNITKGSTFISASIENVCFTASSSYYGLVDGINFSTPNGPSRPFVVHCCNFKRLNRGIYCYYTDTTKSTNLYTLSVIGCNFSINQWGIYATGNHGLGGVNIQDCVIEQNPQGGIYANDASYYVGMGQITIKNNLLEGQAQPIYIKTAGSVEIVGNYFEATSAHKVSVFGDMNNSWCPLRIFGNNHSNNGVRLFTYELAGMMITELKDVGSVNFNLDLSQCVILETQLDSRMYFVTVERSYFAIPQNDDTFIDEPVLNLPITPNTIYDGVACLRTPAANKIGDSYKNITKTIEVGDYRIVAYVRSESASNAFWLVDNANSVIFTKEMKNLRTGNVYMFVHDITVATRISGANKVQFGWRMGSAGSISGSSMNLYTNTHRYLPKTNVRSFSYSSVVLGDIENPKKADNVYISAVLKPVYYNGTKWIDGNGYTPALNHGNTESRPTLASTDIGFSYFDTTIGKMIVWNGTAWVNMDGSALG